MELLCAGLSHHTAPLAVRERFALGPDVLAPALDRLVNREGFAEGLILSTCNRTELYLRRRDAASAGRARAFFGTLCPAAADLGGHVVVREGDAAVSHLFRVAAGLDSPAPGEPEIARRMSEAYGLACSAGTAGALLHRAVPQALKVGGRVRAETGIARGAAGVGGAAAELAHRVFRDLAACSVLAMGADESVWSALEALRPGAAGALVVVNGSALHAEQLAARFGGSIAPTADAARLVGAADIVIASTSASQPQLRRDDLAPWLARRAVRPLLILDLGAPRGFERSVGDLPGVHLHCADDLRAIAARGRAERALEVPRAEAIVTTALSEFRRGRGDLAAAPAIRALLEGVLDVREAALSGEKNLTDSERAAAERVTGKLVDRLLRRIAPRLMDGSVQARQILDAFGIELPAGDA